MVLFSKTKKSSFQRSSIIEMLSLADTCLKSLQLLYKLQEFNSDKKIIFSQSFMFTSKTEQCINDFNKLERYQYGFQCFPISY